MDQAAPSETIREQAAVWLARWKAHGMPDDERRRLDAWLDADARHRREFESMRALWDAVGDLADRPAAQAERRPSAARNTSPWHPALASAFVLVVAFGLVWFGGWEGPGRTLRLATAANERKVVELDAGSRVHLDADSTITAHLAGGRHRILMERGQAWFEVEHRPERRFEVETAAGRIVDIGTRFGVAVDDRERVTVAVAEGEVEVGLREGGSSLRLSAGQGTTLAGGEIRQPSPVDAEAAFAWREGRIVFENLPLPDALARVNRYRAEPIAIADPALDDLRVSGVFRIDDAKGFVWALEQTLPVRAIHRPGRLDLVALRPTLKETPPAPVR